MRVERNTLDEMNGSTANHRGTRWAAYQNTAMDSILIGHLRYLAIGPVNTLSQAPMRCPDTDSRPGWAYQFIGWVNQTTGEILECTPDNPCLYYDVCPKCKSFPGG